MWLFILYKAGSKTDVLTIVLDGHENGMKFPLLYHMFGREKLERCRYRNYLLPALTMITCDWSITERPEVLFVFRTVFMK